MAPAAYLVAGQKPYVDSCQLSPAVQKDGYSNLGCACVWCAVSMSALGNMPDTSVCGRGGEGRVNLRVCGDCCGHKLWGMWLRLGVKCWCGGSLLCGARVTAHCGTLFWLFCCGCCRVMYDVYSTCSQALLYTLSRSSVCPTSRVRPPPNQHRSARLCVGDRPSSCPTAVHGVPCAVLVACFVVAYL